MTLLYSITIFLGAALLFLVQEALPLLERKPPRTGRAKVIALSSHGSNMALPWYGLIGSSKAALESISRHMTLEIGDRGRRGGFGGLRPDRWPGRFSLPLGR